MTAPGAPEERVISIASELNTLLRHRRLMIWLPLTLAVVAVALTVARGRAYVAESRFTPHSGDQALMRAAGLAAQFGITLGGSGRGAEALDFYTELLHSRELLTAAALTQYRFAPRGGGRDTVVGTLVELYEIRASSRDAALLAAVERLRKDVAVSTGLRRAGIVTVATKARSRELAVQINRRLLDLVNEFNLRQRQSQAAAERRFVEGRLGEARNDLGRAEGDLARFLEQNRRYESSPRLAFESQRLQRRVDLAHQVYLTLARAYEEARIEEVRNTPVLTVLDGPEGSVRQAESLRVNAALGIVVGAILALMVAFFREYTARDRQRNPSAYQELDRLANSAVRGLTLRRRRADSQ